MYVCSVICIYNMCILYVCIHYIWYPKKKNYNLSVFTGIYSVLITFWQICFKGINFEGCAWFWDHVFFICFLLIVILVCFGSNTWVPRG